MKKITKLIIPIGPAGCGKTRYYNKNHPDITRISADEIRFEMLNSKIKKVHFDSGIEPLIWKQVWINFIRNIKHEKEIYLDATNLSIRTRSPFINIAKYFGYEIILIYFKTPLIKILQRNAQRERKVDEKMICRQFINMEIPEKYEYDKLIIQEDWDKYRS